MLYLGKKKKKSDASVRVVLAILSSDLFHILVVKGIPFPKWHINGNNIDTLHYTKGMLLLASFHTLIISSKIKHRYNFLF